MPEDGRSVCQVTLDLSVPAHVLEYLPQPPPLLRCCRFLGALGFGADRRRVRARVHRRARRRGVGQVETDSLHVIDREQHRQQVERRRAFAGIALFVENPPNGLATLDHLGATFERPDLPALVHVAQIKFQGAVHFQYGVVPETCRFLPDQGRGIAPPLPPGPAHYPWPFSRLNVLTAFFRPLHDETENLVAQQPGQPLVAVWNPADLKRPGLEGLTAPGRRVASHCVSPVWEGRRGKAGYGPGFGYRHRQRQGQGQSLCRGYGQGAAFSSLFRLEFPNCLPGAERANRRCPGGRPKKDPDHGEPPPSPATGVATDGLIVASRRAP